LGEIGREGGAFHASQTDRARRERACLVGLRRDARGVHKAARARDRAFPVARGHVAGEHHRARAVLLVAAVDDVEEHVGACPVEPAPPDFVHDEARGLHERCDLVLGRPSALPPWRACRCRAARSP
jgi:hypothetical protein